MKNDNNNSDTHFLPDLAPRNRVIVADDDPSIRRLLEVTLQKAGYDVFAAEDGLSALQHALSNSVSAVIADAVMPNLSGYDLCRILRQHESYRNTPLILLSGLDPEISDKDDLADAFLQKGPNLKNEMTSLLAGFLSREVFA